MKKLLFCILSICLAGAFLFSCNKSNNVGTPSTILEGRWSVVQTATDDNNNHKLDAEEYRTLDPNITDYYLFNQNNTGIEEVKYYGAVTDYNFAWALPNSSQFLQLFLEGHDSITYRIITFNPANMTLLDTSQSIYSWKVLKKK